MIVKLNCLDEDRGKISASWTDFLAAAFGLSEAAPFPPQRHLCWDVLAWTLHSVGRRSWIRGGYDSGRGGYVILQSIIVQPENI